MHDHHHDGEPQVISNRKEAEAFLRYALDHNEHHVEELRGLADSLEDLDLNETAEKVRICIGDYERGNQVLGEALASLKA